MTEHICYFQGPLDQHLVTLPVAVPFSHLCAQGGWGTPPGSCKGSEWGAWHEPSLQI